MSCWGSAKDELRRSSLPSLSPLSLSLSLQFSFCPPLPENWIPKNVLSLDDGDTLLDKTDKIYGL